MGAINFCMTDIYGGYGMDTTAMSIPDADDQNALTDTTTANTKPIIKNAVKDTSNTRLYLAIALLLIIVIVVGGRM